MNFLNSAILVLCLSALTVAEKVNYSGDSVIQVIPKSKNGLQVLQKLDELGAIKIWAEFTALNRPSSFRVSSSDNKWINRVLTDQGLSPTVLVPDVQQLIDEQDKGILLRQMARGDDKAFDLENFHPYPELIEFMQEIAANNSRATYSVIGQSYEGRDIGQVIFQDPSGSTKPIIFLECGIHAREWVSPATCIWIMNELANLDGIDPEITELLNVFDWIVVPTSNPDGYEYTWTTNRLWRKNRALTDVPACPGVDLNRNYASNFGGVGSSDVPCSETYHGLSAFSESESVAIRSSLEANNGRIRAYVSIHSYGQLWMSPYGYDLEVPADYTEMLRVMEIGAQAIRETNGVVFETGDEAHILYLTSGTTRDYAYLGHNITYAYTIESREMPYGFVPPPSEIEPTATEIWNGIKAMAKSII